MPIASNVGKKITMDDLARFLRAAWSRETSADPKNWSYENPAWGQSVVTALIVQRFFEGEIIRLDISAASDPKIANLRSHYFNKINGRDIDFSASQFIDVAIYESLLAKGIRTRRARKELLSNSDTERRYRRLYDELVKLVEEDFVKN